MMMLQAASGVTLAISADGEGAEDLCQDLRELIEGGFGEELDAELAAGGESN
jgi:phosphotransferase system HPr-like phosphotransfer protein